MAHRSCFRILQNKSFPIKKLIYRLPSEKEWKKAAWGNLPEGSMWPWEGTSVRWKGGKRKHEGLILFNFRRGGQPTGIAGRLTDAGFITTPVYSYWDNTIGLYNMCGNVAEWTEEHKAMGGSWNDYGYHCQIITPKPVLHDSTRLSTLGFRCVAEIVEYEDDYKIDPLNLSAKKIEKQMKIIPDTAHNNLIFASETEVSNQEYHTFLSENINSSNPIQNELWANHTRYKEQQLYGWHKDYSLYPVLNIEYEDALAYCKWLTDKYNSLAERKYQKVIFRLPTFQEWENAARGGREEDMYPWGGPYTQNSKGCYLANFTPIEPQYIHSYSSIYYYSIPGHIIKSNGDTIESRYSYTSDRPGFNNSYDSSDVGYKCTYPNNDSTISRGVDGSYFPAKLKSYYPNDYGLYCMAGNVSEMLAEKGKSKGGSWVSNQDEIQNASPAETYTKANCTTGFRVFMEVLEK